MKTAFFVALIGFCLVSNVFTMGRESSPTPTTTSSVSEGLQIVEGLLEGALKGVSLPDIEKCFDDAENVVSQCTNAIELFIKGNPADVAEAVKEMATAFSEVPTAISACSTAVDEAEVLIHQIDNFSNPLSFLWAVGKSLIVNGVEVYDDIQTGIQDFRQKEYKNFGYQIGTALALVVEGTESSQTELTPALSEGLQIVEGLVEGALNGVKLADFVQCFDDAENVIQECVSAVELFTKETPGDIAQALQEIEKAFSQVPPAISTCTTAVHEAEQLAEELAAFSNPVTIVWKIGKSLIVNGAEIFGDVSTGIADFKQGQYKNFGYEIGVALGTVVEGTQSITMSEVATSEGLLIVEGLLEGALDGLSLSDVVQCFDDAENVVKQCVSAVELFTQGNASDIAKALQEIAQAFSQLPPAISTCTNAFDAAEELAKEIEAFSSPATFVYEVGKSLILNGAQIFGDISTAISDFKHGQYKNFGYEVGSAMATVLTGTQQQLEQPDLATSEGLQIVEGLLEGALDGLSLSDIIQCFEDAETVVKECVSAVELFTQETPTAIAQALQEVAKALSSLPPAISTCTNAVDAAEELAKEIEAFASPATFVYEVGKSLILNGAEIFGDVSTAISDYKKGQYKNFGYEIGIAMGSVLTGGVKSNVVATPSSPTEGLLIVEGLLEGALNGLHLSDIVECFEDVKSVVTECVSAVELFTKGNATSIAQAMQEIAKAFSDVPTTISTCTNAVDAAEELAKEIEAFASPVTFVHAVGKSLILNGSEIFGDISTAITDFKNGQYKNFGFQIGSAMGTVLAGAQLIEQESTIASSEGLQIVEGLLDGALNGIHLTDVIECFDDAETVVKECVGAVELFTQGSASDIAKAVQQISQAFSELPHAISTCTTAYDDAKQLAAEIESFASPATFVYAVGKSLILNGSEIFGDISSAITAYKSKRYENFGYEVGIAMGTVLAGAQETALEGEMDFSSIDLIVSGILSGAFNTNKLSISTCLQDVASIADGIVQVIDLFGKGNSLSVKTALKTLAQTLEELPRALSACGQAEVEAEALAKELAILSNPTTFKFRIGKSLLLNGVEIYKEIFGGLAAYRYGNYYEFGYDIGAVLNEILQG